MMIVDTALKAREAEGNPIRVGIVGAGFMGEGLTNHIVNTVPGMRVVAISNRHPERGAEVFRYAGVEPVIVDSEKQFDDVVRSGRAAVTDDALVLCRSDNVDIVCEITGAVDFGAQVLLEAFSHGKDVVLLNAEVEATLGPILHTYADKGGAILSACDGDEPGVQLDLYRWVKSLGLEPRVIGNVKGLQDPYRNPTTQTGVRREVGAEPEDGDVVRRWLEDLVRAGHRRQRDRIHRAEAWDVAWTRVSGRCDEDRSDLRHRGGASPRRDRRLRRRNPADEGVRARRARDPKQQHYLNFYKLGEGPLYSFFVPYHLVHFDVPNSIARVALYRDSSSKPLGGPLVEVCAVAKRDLRAGETLDDYGEYMTYGEAVGADEMSERRYASGRARRGVRPAPRHRPG